MVFFFFLSLFCIFFKKKKKSSIVWHNTIVHLYVLLCFHNLCFKHCCFQDTHCHFTLSCLSPSFPSQVESLLCPFLSLISYSSFKNKFWPLHEAFAGSYLSPPTSTCIQNYSFISTPIVCMCSLSNGNKISSHKPLPA